MSIRARLEKLEGAVAPRVWLGPILSEERTRELHRLVPDGRVDALMAHLTTEELEAIIYSGPHNDVIRALSSEILEAIADGRIGETQLERAIKAGKGDPAEVNAALIRTQTVS